MTDFRLERTYAADRDRVWAHLTEPALMAQWFSPNPSLDVSCDVDLRPGGAWRCTMGPYGVGGVVTEVAAPERLAYTWSWDHDEDPETTVVFTLREAESGGTRLVLEHAETAPDVGQDGHEGGWTITLDRLGALL